MHQRIPPVPTSQDGSHVPPPAAPHPSEALRHIGEGSKKEEAPRGNVTALHHERRPEESGTLPLFFVPQAYFFQMLPSQMLTFQRYAFGISEAVLQNMISFQERLLRQCFSQELGKVRQEEQ
jgi:hypothetical protein